MNPPSSRPLKIGLLAPAFRGFNALDGGIGAYLADLAIGLANAGHAVRVITAAPAPDTPAPASVPGLSFVTFDGTLPTWLYQLTRWRWQAHTVASWYWRARQAARVVQAAHATEPFDCIETSSSGLLPMLLVRAKHRPPIITRIATTASQLVTHNSGPTRWIDRLEQRWEQSVVQRSDALVTHTTLHREELIRQWNLAPSSVHLVPLGIAIAANDALPASTATRSPRVLYVGRCEHRKGVDILLAAIPLVLAAAPGTSFNLIGQDQNDYWQHHFWRENPDIPRGQVRFHGKVTAETLTTAYRDCDIFVAPSRYESFGLIYVEAMAWGKPVVGCRAGGIPEVIEDEVTGLLAKPGNAESLGQALIRLCLEPELRARLGQQARRHTEEKFSREVFAYNSAALYRRIIAENRL